MVSGSDFASYVPNGIPVSQLVSGWAVALRQLTPADGPAPALTLTSRLAGLGCYILAN